jgi:predicted transcriptional regulator
MLSLKDASIVSEVFSELASETRCSILISLDKKPAKLSSIARELDITSQDAFRNINRLLDAGLVRRGGGDEDGGSFQLTELGRLATKHIPYFLVIKKHQELFEDHTLKYIPDKFVQRIGALQNCEVISSVSPVFERLKKLESNAKQYLRIMVSQAWPEEGKILAERAINDVEVCTIIGRNTVFPKEVIESVIPPLDGLQKSGKIKRKMLDTVSIAIYISDSQSAVMLPNRKEEVDMGMLLVGTDPSFNEWCLDLFNYFWERAGPQNLDKAKIV